MNLVQPEYLGNDDIFLSGDAQKTSLDLLGSLSQVA
ncbi:MAG: hypothetical protein PG981_001314 [Wolbachia endosymbiont of Ctenocephalides orientis wCori]|nr:MAG: hypothetical protein PG981_001314 [Wolbachia endosymbiont of Ctenocephalides orientis wCori]